MWAERPYKSDRFISGTGTARVSGKTVAVTLASAVAQDERPWVMYEKGDDVNPLREASSGPVVADFRGFAHTTVHDRTAPKLTSGIVAGTKLRGRL